MKTRKIEKQRVFHFVVAVGVVFGMLAANGRASDGVAPPAAAVKWFEKRLSGNDGVFPDDEVLDSAAEVDERRAGLWAAYAAAARSLGWDRELNAPQEAGPLPTRDDLARMPADERPPMPQFEAGVLAAGDERMPYFLFTRGERPASGFPLFFQTHGGGSTDQELEHPHAWQVNTRDWRAQLGVCLFALPEGMYFVPRMANDNRGRWWKKHNHQGFDRVIRLGVLFHGVDPNRIYMMGISEGAYGTEALTPFWADRFAGGVAMAGGAGGGERFHNLRNTAFRNDTGENDTMFGRVTLAREAHDFLAMLKRDDPEGFDHMLMIHEGRGHGIDYQPGPAWIATKRRNPKPDVLRWFNFALDGERRTDFSWLSLAERPVRDTLITAAINRGDNQVVVTAMINPPGVNDESPVYNTSTPEPVANRIPYTGNTLTVHLDDEMLDLSKPVSVVVNGREAFSGVVGRKTSHLADDIARHGDPGRVWPARIALELSDD